MSNNFTMLSSRLKKFGSNHVNTLAFLASTAFSSCLLLINENQISDSIAHNNGLYFIFSFASIICAELLFMWRSNALARLVAGAIGAWILFIFLDFIPKAVSQSIGWFDFVSKLFGGILVSILWSALPMCGYVILNIFVWFLLIKILPSSSDKGIKS